MTYALLSRTLVVLVLTIVSVQLPVARGSSRPAISQLRLSWKDDPRTSMTVTWQVQDPSTNSHVEYGLRKSQLNQRAKATSCRYSYETGIVRTATLSHLEAETTYFYRVVGAEGATKVRLFRTAPRRHCSFKFTAYGDQGVTPEAIVITKRVASEHPAFHLHFGDLSYANGTQPIWDAWLDLIEPLSSRVPYMPTLGNHENESIGQERIGYVAYLARFALPRPETWYKFDYCGVRLIAFNSDDFTNPEQMHWFRQTLHSARQDNNVRWVIVYQHHPPYSSNLSRENNVYLIEALVKTLDEFQVDLVLAGHNHNYERTLPMRAGKVTHKDRRSIPRGKGTIYVVSGGGGKPLYGFVAAKPVWCASREKTHNYLRIRADDKSLHVRAIRQDGSTIDQFTIRAPS